MSNTTTSYHDELANTDAKNHSAATTAPVENDVPQGPGHGNTPKADKPKTASKPSK